MSFTYKNPSYIGSLIHLGGQGIPVNDGVLVISDIDNQKWGGQMNSLGFSLEVEPPVVANELPKIEQSTIQPAEAVIELEKAAEDVIKEETHA